ncbi:MAG: F0F1 ATP synthase subunit alpha [Candidatus Omnitrophica bacterium]|nr:F0F1 ATP synthase subunit alpha [Candidatus Omnitrophota bacterium]MDD5488848.1 F0F1 ATP synthase subunit alpha [Candidatus Omnitrophota bacterium]
MGPLQYKEYGKVTQIKGCIVTVTGLDNCISGQLVHFGYGTEGIIIGFDADEAQVLLVKEKKALKTGDKAELTLEPFNTPVGKNFIGRIVNPLGEPLDDLGPIVPDDYFPIFPDCPSVMDRGGVEDTLETGIKIVDAMLPIGKGQRQLVLGDKMTGKTTICTDTILNQKGKGIICIYCCIGKSRSALERVINLFKENNTFDYTIIVAAIAGTSPGQQYLVPYVGCSLGEYFMRSGGHVFVAFDDFTKHAWAYREMSLLLGRAPGRESYPGDVFYLHSQMIERAAQLSQELGGGSMTFFPIVEILEGDLTGYISTNLVSMTDGQIYLNAALFGEGFKPAIDLGLSVSRIGNKAQWKAMTKICKALKLSYLQYREMLKLSRLKAGGSKTDGVSDEMRGGELLSKLLMQPQNAPLDMEEEILIFYGLNKKHIYELDNDQVTTLMGGIYGFAKEKYPELLKEIRDKKKIEDSMENKLDMLYSEYIDILMKEKQEKEPEGEEEETVEEGASGEEGES